MKLELFDENMSDEDYKKICNADNRKEIAELLCVNGKYQVLIYLIEHGVFFDASYGELHNSFLICCEKGYIDIVKYLCAFLDIEEICDNSNEALVISCIYNRLEIVKYLCENVLSTEDIYRDGSCAFYKACINNSIDVVKYMRQYMSDIDMEDAFISSCKLGHYEIVKFLCENTYCSNLVNLNTLLYFCCVKGHSAIILYMCQKYNMFEAELIVKV